MSNFTERWERSNVWLREMAGIINKKMPKKLASLTKIHFTSKR